MGKFRRLSVQENLRTGFAAAPRDQRSIPAEMFSCFRIVKDMLRRRGGDLSGGQQQQLAIARALVMRRACRCSMRQLTASNPRSSSTSAR